ASVAFSIRHLSIAKVRGRFTRVDTEVVIGESLETSSVKATVELSSVDTGEPDRDAHIRAEDMVDVASRPTMTFVSTAIKEADEHWIVDGDLTIGDTTRPLRLELEFGGVVDFPLGGPRHAGVTATGELRRSDYGIAPAYPPALLGDVVKVEIDLELL